MGLIIYNYPTNVKGREIYRTDPYAPGGRPYTNP